MRSGRRTGSSKSGQSSSVGQRQRAASSSQLRTIYARAIASFASRFHSILEQLRAAAPTAEIIVSGAWNPEVGLQQAEPLYRALDKTIARSAAKSRARVANTYAALTPPGTARARRARLCVLTFFCSRSDLHPTDAGYRAMAGAFMAASGYPRKP